MTLQQDRQDAGHDDPPGGLVARASDASSDAAGANARPGGRVAAGFLPVRTVWGLDPGQLESALVAYEPAAHRVGARHLVSNDVMLSLLRCYDAPGQILIVETMTPRGMRIDAPTMDTIFVSGRFYETWTGRKWTISRDRAKRQICGTSGGDDTAVRRMLIERWDRNHRAAIGRKRAPGPLFGIGTSHMWAALAVAVAYCEIHGIERNQK